MFCYPENIKPELTKVFHSLRMCNQLQGLEQIKFVEAITHIVAELNAIHAFRDGNGRVQLAFLALLSFKAGHPVNLEKLNPKVFLEGMIESFKGNEQLLAIQIKNIL